MTDLADGGLPLSLRTSGPRSGRGGRGLSHLQLLDGVGLRPRRRPPGRRPLVRARPLGLRFARASSPKNSTSSSASCAATSPRPSCMPCSSNRAADQNGRRSWRSLVSSPAPRAPPAPRSSSVRCQVFRVPTDQPEADGTLEWSATTVVVVEVAAAGWWASAGPTRRPDVEAVVDQELAERRRRDRRPGRPPGPRGDGAGVSEPRSARASWPAPFRRSTSPCGT